jgi:DNA-binding Lrp family transcriptional regulator
LENIVADFGCSISADCAEEEAQKLKRNAFVFITTEIDSIKMAIEDLRKLEGVREVYLSRGAYDIVAKIRGESLDHLREIVFKRIKNLSSVKSTLTLMLI